LAIPRDDHVIEHAHVQQLQRRLQRLRQVLIGPAGIHVPRRMVARQHHRRRVQPQRLARNFARVHGRLLQRPPEHLPEGQQPVLRIERRHAEHLVLQRPELHRQKRLDHLG
jgi:hypothetical protein